MSSNQPALSFLTRGLVGGLCGCGCQPEKPDTACVVGGYSSELCGEAGQELISSCIWQDSFACYQKLGVCERQADGACGWTVTEDLKLCLSNTRVLVP
jgi:hypothetical protein